MCLWILIYTIFQAFLYHNYMPEKATGPQFRIRGLILLTWTQIISVTCAFDVTRIWTLASYDAKSVDKKLMHSRYAILHLKQNMCVLWKDNQICLNDNLKHQSIRLILFRQNNYIVLLEHMSCVFIEYYVRKKLIGIKVT